MVAIEYNLEVVNLGNNQVNLVAVEGGRNPHSRLDVSEALEGLGIQSELPIRIPGPVGLFGGNLVLERGPKLRAKNPCFKTRNRVAPAGDKGKQTTFLAGTQECAVCCGECITDCNLSLLADHHAKTILDGLAL